MNDVTPIPRPMRAPEQVVFHRIELGQIMTLYGRMVAAGEWRDYGISMQQQQYAVIGMDGRILKRGADLKQVLRVLEKKLIRAVE